jgi:hypothetical protein
LPSFASLFDQTLCARGNHVDCGSSCPDVRRQARAYAHEGFAVTPRADPYIIGVIADPWRMSDFGAVWTKLNLVHADRRHATGIRVRHTPIRIEDLLQSPTAPDKTNQTRTKRPARSHRRGLRIDSPGTQLDR